MSPEVPTLKGTEASLSYVQCFLYFASSSVNVSIFHITWLDTFWTGLVCVCVCVCVCVMISTNKFLNAIKSSLPKSKEKSFSLTE